MSILFVGNSHTSTHDIPASVEALLETSEDIEDATVATQKAGFLRTALNQSAVTDAVSSGDWDIVVLQGQEISRSHSINYSQGGSIALATKALDAGSRVLFFSEWKREGVDETEYIENIYNEIAAKSGTEVIPIGRAWDRFLEEQPSYALWSSDGNHSSPGGAFLAAAAIAFYLLGSNAELTAGEERQMFLEPARQAIAEYLQPGRT